MQFAASRVIYEEWTKVQEATPSPETSNATPGTPEEPPTLASTAASIVIALTLILAWFFGLYLLYLGTIYREHMQQHIENTKKECKRSAWTAFFEKSGRQMTIVGRNQKVDQIEDKDSYSSGDEETPEEKVTIPQRTKDGAERKVENSCIICLGSYHDGDVMVWSQDPECRHAFHRQCFIDYLVAQKSQDASCPVCRRDFVGGSMMSS
eukprot:Nitzschia sp. Nitz4//scaffold37_size175936//8684//9376//NITZ4_002022-RA/size175936-processed-gene-0.168-mRNA-1//1//CDS//3329549716//7379//frame0